MVPYKLILLVLLVLFPISPKSYAFALEQAFNKGREKEQSNILTNDFKEFRTLTVNDGFTRNSIFDIYQDKIGFVWFGSWDGVYRYDGSCLQRIYHTHKQDSRDRQVITAILEDDDNRIWIGSTRGIAIWDADDERLSAFSDIIASGEFKANNVKSLCKDNTGHIWIVTQSELYVFNMDEQKLTNVTYLLKGKISHVNHIYMGVDHQLWLTTNKNGIFRIQKSGSANASDDKWVLVEEPLFADFKNSNVLEFFQDSLHNFWLGLNRGIVHVIRDKSSDADHHLPICETYSSPEHKSYQTTSFAEGNGCVYATTNHGLFLYSLDDHQHSWVLPDYSETGSLTDQNLRKVMVDREGGIWLGSFYGGVNYVSPTAGNFSSDVHINKYLNGHVVSGIAEDVKGNIWFGVEDGGVAYWNRHEDQVFNFANNRNLGYQPARKNVQGIYADDKNVYVGTYGGGVDIIDVSTMKSRNLNKTNTVPDPIPDAIYSFLKVSDRYLLMGGIDGLYFLDINQFKTHKVHDVEGKVNCIIKDTKGDVWVSTIYNGVYQYEEKKDRWRHFIHDSNDSTSLVCNDINTMIAVNSSVYLGTQGNGLWEYRQNEGRFFPIAPDVLGNTLVFKILPFGDSFWVTTNQGLFSYNRVTGHIQKFTSKDGLRSNLFKENSGTITSDGLYMVGGVNGVNCFWPSRLQLTLVKPQVILTELSIFNKTVDVQSEDSPLKESITYSDHLEINQKCNNIAFHFSSSSYNDPNKNVYQYKLEPFEQEWQRTTQQNNSATYTNLPAGTYIFKVRTSNGIGAWSDEKCLQLTVHPFWWWSVPMKVIYVVVFLLLVALYYRRSQNKRKEEMRLFQFEKEQEMYHSKMEFFTCMVHEIRTPLTLILGPLNAIMKKSGTIEEAKSELHIIERNGKRLLSLVNQLMDFRKVEEKSYTVQMEVVNLKELVEQITNEFKLYTVKKSVTFELHLPEEPCWANIDREALTKILGNLLSNGVKFTKDKITVSLLEVPGKNFWEIRVRDNGCGIAQKDQSSIFDSFYQVHQNMPSDYIGTGIGLFVVRRLLELQGGTISLESKLNEGSCFIASVQRVEVPSLPEKTDNVETVTSLQKNSTENNKESEHRHLLVVEDNEEMRSYIVTLLSEKYVVDGCENGKVALERIAQSNYDLVITDLMMPVMDGMTLCKRIKNEPLTSHIPVIILTAKDDESSQKEGFDSEADLYVTKPFSADVLLSQVKAIINNRDRMRKQFYSEPETTTAVLCTNNADKEFLERLDECISQHLENCSLSVDDLASQMALGRSVFYQKVKGVTGLTPNDYLRTFRLKKATVLFQNGETRISEVCYRVGFSSPSYFTKRFTMQFGISPSDYLKKLEH